MTSIHFYAWKKGLKTGQYYLRSRPAVDPIKFTLNVEELLKDSGGVDMKGLNFNRNNDNSLKKQKKKVRKRVKVKREIKILKQ